MITDQGSTSRQGSDPVETETSVPVLMIGVGDVNPLWVACALVCFIFDVINCVPSSFSVASTRRRSVRKKCVLCLGPLKGPIF